MNSNISVCPTHNIKFDSTKYQGCIACTYRQCLKCSKYNINHDSQYQTCFTCNTQDKQPCIQCKTNLVKQPYKYCFQCNQGRSSVLPQNKVQLAQPTLMKSIEPTEPQYVPMYMTQPLKFYHQ